MKRNASAGTKNSGSLQYENKILQEEFERAKNYYEKEKDNIRAQHGKELEELFSAQNLLIENINSFEQSIKELEAMAENNLKDKENLNAELALQKEKLAGIMEKYEFIESEKNRLQDKLGYLLDELKHLRKNYSEYLSSIIDYFGLRAKDQLGTVLGIANYCLQHLRIGRGRVFKKQLVILSEIVDGILQTIEGLTGLVFYNRLDFQEISVERLFAKLGDTIDTSHIPVALKLKVNYPELKRVISPYTDRALKANIRCSKIPVGNLLTLDIVVPGEVKLDAEFVQLKHIVFLHEWRLAVVFENDTTTITIEIPVMGINQISNIKM